MSMFDRIFLYVEDRTSSTTAAELALSLAKSLAARVFAIAVINTAGSIQTATRRKRIPDVEEDAWRILYEIEDDAFKQEVSISLLLDQGDPLERLLDLARSYRAKLIVASPATRLPLAEFVRRSPVPVVFANLPRRHDDQNK